MKYSFLFFVFSLFILKINPSTQALFKNQGSHETQKTRTILHGKRQGKTWTRRKTRKNKKPLKKRRSRKQSLRTKAASARQSVAFTGNACDFVDFGAVRNSGSSCSDGSKMVLKHKTGNRKQFLIADSRTIYAFAQNGQKFPTCQSFKDMTCQIQCKAVEGLSSVSLRRSNSKIINERVYTGNNCEWIDLNQVSDNSNCNNGDKFVIKNRRGENRKQFLFIEGRTILAFVPNGRKFHQCSEIDRIEVIINDCRPVVGASSIILPTCNPSIYVDAVLITGGIVYESGITAELYRPDSGVSCSLESLPGHTFLHSVESTKLLCGGQISWEKCYKWNSGSWDYFLTLDVKRYGHVSWTPTFDESPTYLMGGEDSDRTTTKIDTDTGEQTPSFTLKHSAIMACAIPVAVENLPDNFPNNIPVVVITGGGYDTTVHKKVSIYNEREWENDLPDLRYGRWHHACTSYKDAGGNTILLVTGGWSGSTVLETTETFDLGTPTSSWITGPILPKRMSGLRAVNIDDRVLLFGGFTSDPEPAHHNSILEYDIDEHKFKQIDSMNMARSRHAISEVKFEDFATWCT